MYLSVTLQWEPYMGAFSSGMFVFVGYVLVINVVELCRTRMHVVHVC